jgi:hypothetical protein
MDIAAFPGIRREHFTAFGPLSTESMDLLRRMDRALWILLAGIALFRIAFHRHLRWLVLLVLPVLVAAALNLKFLWPFGPVRTNLFMLAYTTALICVGLDTNRVALARHWSRFLPLLVLVLLPVIFWERGLPRVKTTATRHSEFIQATRALLELQGAAPPSDREILILDGWSRDVWRYYDKVHPGHQELFAELASRFDVRRPKRISEPLMAVAHRVVPRGTSRFWILVTRPSDLEFFARGAPRRYGLLTAKRMPEGSAMVVALRRP